MRELNGADRYQLYIESPTHHQHTLKVLLVDTTRQPRPLTLAGLREWAEATVPSCPPLCWQLASMPLGQPVWIDSPAFVVEHHVNHEVLAGPGDQASFTDLLARLQETKLDRTRPLWRLWLVDGFATEQIALVWSLHHALADGGGTVEMFERLFDHDPDGPFAPGEPFVSARRDPEPRPRATELLRVGIRSAASTAARFPRLLSRSRHAIRVNRKWRAAEVAGPARPFAAPSTPFGHALTEHRTCATVSVPLDDVMEVRKTFGCTVNDVFLATASGALASFLASTGDRPARSLTASVPVSVRSENEARSFGNFISTWFVRLATDVDDPVERLDSVHRHMRAVRELAEQRRAERLQLDWMEHTWLFKAYIALGTLSARRVGRPPFSAILSSVKGPAPLWFAGAPITEIQSYSQLAAGIGLNITAWSYNGKLTVGLAACPESGRDLWDLAGRFGSALEELKTAADQRAIAA